MKNIFKSTVCDQIRSLDDYNFEATLVSGFSISLRTFVSI